MNWLRKLYNTTFANKSLCAKCFDADKVKGWRFCRNCLTNWRTYVG